MNHYTIYELLWLFFLYSFGGWILETVLATLKQKKFANRGLVNGPYCVMYGFTAVLMTVGLQELTGFWLFLFAAVYATVVEWIGGHLMERIFKERWWDYSNVKWNLDGYICLPASLAWGGLGYIAVRWGNVLSLDLLHLLPELVMKILILVLLLFLCVDVFASFMLLTGISRNPKQWEETDAQIDKLSARLSSWISERVERRVKKAYLRVRKTEKKAAEKSDAFASGCGFYKIVLLFIIGAFLGDITETIFCRITMGVWMSRSSVVWGPFSIVWGLAIALVTALLYKYKDRSNTFLFLIGTLLGGAYEYLCSVFTEIFFGKVFWDYSNIPFNLGGRINLLYCFFWGIAAVVWFKRLYPPLEKWIERIPQKVGKIITWGLLVFMCCNIMVSCMALVRYDEREKGIRAETRWEHWTDEHYDDVKMKKIYPNAKGVKKEKTEEKDAGSKAAES